MREANHAEGDPRRMREVTLDIRHYGEPEYEASSGHPAVTMRSVSSMTGHGDVRKRILELEGPPEAIEGYLTTFRAADSVVKADPLTPLGEDHVYFVGAVDAERKHSISTQFSEMGLHYRTGTTISDGVERWTVYLEPDDDLAALIRALERGGNDVELVRNVPISTLDRPPELSVTRLTEDLTRRQRDVLVAAIELGYYDHGAGVDIEAVAAAVDLGSTTVWEHLSRAESKVMNRLVDRLSV